ncbi:MAG: hypothetical protein HY505_01895 [Candidatus Yanofskybacteria bacterium]|nr:hypothetical protein [Candidatus Yanofskybacteria bacterium]
MEKYKQNIAVDMRKRGFSYSEIENRLHIPKSTLSYWLKNIKLTPEQTQKLNDKRIEVAKANALKKISKTSRMIEEIKKSSSQDVKEISKKELWLIGVVLYWKNGNKNDLKKGVHFSSSNPDMIKLFLKWLRDVGCVEDKEIKFDIFQKGNKAGKKNSSDEFINYWAKITGFSKEHFTRIYFQKTSKKREGINGFLRIKVAQSSMLARQIAGWIEGIKNINNLS